MLRVHSFLIPSPPARYCHDGCDSMDIQVIFSMQNGGSGHDFVFAGTGYGLQLEYWIRTSWKNSVNTTIDTYVEMIEYNLFLGH